MAATAQRCLEGVHCSLVIERPAPQVVVVIFRGTDIGELGDAPFLELERLLGEPPESRTTSERGEPFELFIDARRARAASIDVSGQWATWLLRRRASLVRVHMLTGTRLIQVSAAFVRAFAGLEGAMCIDSSASAFEAALARAVAARPARAP